MKTQANKIGAAYQFSVEAINAINELQLEIMNSRLQNNADVINKFNELTEATNETKDEFCMEAINDSHDLDNLVDEVYLQIADEAALMKFILDTKTNPGLSAATKDGLARQHLADEHGLDLDDLNADWNVFVTDLQERADLY